MAQATSPSPAKLIVGLLGSRREWLDAAIEGLVDLYGPVDIQSEVIDFDFTDYYREQMGDGLLRTFVAFDRLIDPGDIADIKLATNAMEADLAERFEGAPRPVNIDPGYVQLPKLVLATAKDFAHRIYVRDGIYAEVTLTYRGGKWESWPWTFPDYSSGRYDDVLTAVRNRLKQQQT